ncbi:MAG: hypothetical protein PHT69_08075 [Bacteroidales bacterium]|nr:hypothetical protein [Bacteroidales bacterium]
MKFNLQKIFYCLIILIIINLYACNDKKDLTPAYIKVDEVTLNTTFVQGTNSHRINDIWVYINDDIQGVYELPAHFPVLSEGTYKMNIKPGILMNGIGATRIYYPFFEAVEMEVTFERGTTQSFNLSTAYQTETVFKWMENFEDGGISLEKTTKSEVDITKTDNIEDVFEGNFSAKAVLDSNKSIFECHTINAYELPKYGAPVFLEMNYKINSQVHVGIYAYSPSQVVQRAVLILNATDTWKKIYINLTNAVSENINATEFRIFFGMLKNEDESIVPTAYFDNIKLIHF